MDCNSWHICRSGLLLRAIRQKGISVIPVVSWYTDGMVAKSGRIENDSCWQSAMATREAQLVVHFAERGMWHVIGI